MVSVFLDGEIEIACFFFYEDACDWLLSSDADIFWSMANSHVSIG